MYGGRSAGGHGLGMRKQGTNSDHWIDEFYYWLEAQGSPGRRHDKGGRGTLTWKHRGGCVLPLCHDPVLLREEFKHRRIVFVAGVRLHRLRGLRALTAEAQVELTDEFDVSAVLTNQNDAFQYLGDRVHDSNLLSCFRLGRVRADGCDVAAATTQGEYTIA